MRDLDVRVAVLNWLNKIHAEDTHTRVVEEMGIWSGSVRVDVAVINGELQGFELKSARDTLIRLPFQAEIYSQVFDRVTLVVAQKHADKAKRLVPRWWGLSYAVSMNDQSVKIIPKRSARRNPTVQPVQLARLLWRNEAIAVLEKHGLAKGYRSKSCDILVERLVAEIPLDMLRDSVRLILKSREGWLRNNMASERNVAIDANCDPVT